MLLKIIGVFLEQVKASVFVQTLLLLLILLLFNIYLYLFLKFWIWGPIYYNESNSAAMNYCKRD